MYEVSDVAWLFSAYNLETRKEGWDDHTTLLEIYNLLPHERDNPCSEIQPKTRCGVRNFFRTKLHAAKDVGPSQGSAARIGGSGKG